MSADVTPLRIESVLVSQGEEDVEAASVSGIARVKVVLDRELYAFEESEISQYFKFVNGSAARLNDLSFIGKKLTFSTADPHAANLFVDHLTTQSKNLAERTRERRSEAAEMLRGLEAELQPRTEGDFRPNLSS